MNEEFTLEKLEIVKKLDALGMSMAGLVESNKNIEKLLGQHHAVLYGNGTPGINVRVDRLEQDFKSRQWHLRSLWALVVAAIAKILHLSLK